MAGWGRGCWVKNANNTRNGSHSQLRAVPKPKLCAVGGVGAIATALMRLGTILATISRSIRTCFTLARRGRPGAGLLLGSATRADQLGDAVHDLAMSRRWRRGLRAASVGLALATLAGMIALRPDGSARRPDLKRLGIVSAFHDGVVKRVEPGACPNIPPNSGVACDLVTVRLLDGPDEGHEIALEFTESVSNPDLSPDEVIVLSYVPEAGPDLAYRFADRERRPTLLWLGVIFALATVALGRLRGVTALVGLAASLAILLSFALPAVIDGQSPIAVAIVAAAEISFPPSTWPTVSPL